MVRSFSGIIVVVLYLAGCTPHVSPPPPEVPPPVTEPPAPTQAQTQITPQATDVPVEPTQGPCKFKRTTLSFEGSKTAQAKCLLTPVKRWAELGGAVTNLPTPLDQIGSKPPVTKTQFRTYIASLNIPEKDLGGSLELPLSTTNGGFSAAYFVIHDTSTPNYELGAFPANINVANWRHNDLSRWTQDDKKIAHVFTNRHGLSATTLDFSSAWRATKLERLFGGTPSRGRFLHIENIQPRRSLDSAFAGNDALAPDPGFPEAQYRRLALIYLAASLRADEMLVPAFHAVIDSGIDDAHDDPQKFDLNLWAQILAAEITAAKAM